MSRNLVNAIIVLITAVGGWWVGRAFNCSVLIDGNSMEPTLYSGQLVSCNRHPVPIARGMIVLVSRFPDAPCIKRVVGLPNETVSFLRGEVFINGRMLFEPYIPQDMTTYSWDKSCLRAEGDQYVLLGDNRSASIDSREYGAIPRSQIIATVDIPCALAQLLEQPRYRIKLRHDPLAHPAKEPYLGQRAQSASTPSS